MHDAWAYREHDEDRNIVSYEVPRHCGYDLTETPTGLLSAWWSVTELGLVNVAGSLGGYLYRGARERREGSSSSPTAHFPFGPVQAALERLGKDERYRCAV